MDVILLSRLQFAFTIGFHFIFVSINMGLAWMLVMLETLAKRNKDGEVYLQAAKFFAGLFAITFVVGVASGIVMEFQVGMNWGVFSRFAGDIFGTFLASEVLTAFFLESTFLGLYLFGRGKVPGGVHWFSILMVAAGSTISAFWILAANSWQQTPAGFTVTADRIELADFHAALLNPSTIPRFLHTLDATLITGAFFIAGVASYLILQGKGTEVAKKSIYVAVISGLIFSILQVVPFGHDHAVQVAQTQPEKFAVLEGVYQTQSRVPFVLFGIPTTDPPSLKARIEIPGLLSLVTFGSIDARIKGINEFPPGDIPPLVLPFAAFRVMVILGIYFIVLSLLGVVQLYRGRLWDGRLLLKLFIWSIPLPIIASQLGWIAAEVGRQPWIIYKVLKTADAASVAVSHGEVLFSIIFFTMTYLFIGVLYVYLITKKIKGFKGEELITYND